jgi:hypothetical protein
MNWKSTAAVSGAGLLATWLGWTPTRPATVNDAPATTRDVRPVYGVDIQEQATRLQMRVRNELEYQDPKRNPFRFVVRPAAIARRSQAIETPPAVPAAPAEILPALSGMATDMVDGQAQRTAIFSRGGEVLFAKEGDRLGSYTVTHIDEAGVELAAADGTVRRVPLTP